MKSSLILSLNAAELNLLNDEASTSTVDYKSEYKRLVDYLESELKLLGADVDAADSKAKGSSSSSKDQNADLLKSKLDKLDMKQLSKVNFNKKENLLKYKRMSMHLNNLAFAFNRLNEHEKAICCYKKSLEIKELIAAKKIPPLSSSIETKQTKVSSSSSSSKSKSKDSKQQQQQRRSKSSSNAADLKLKHNLALSYNNVGATYSFLNDYENSIRFYEKSLIASKNLLVYSTPKAGAAASNSAGSDDQNKIKRNIANQFNNIGLAYNRLGKHDLALKNHEEALKIRQNLFQSVSSCHPDVADSMNNLANSFFHLGLFKDSLYYHEKSLEMRKQMVSLSSAAADNSSSSYVDDPLFKMKNAQKEIALSLYNLGIVSYHMRKYEKSLEYLEESMRQLNKRLLHISFKSSSSSSSAAAAASKTAAPSAMSATTSQTSSGYINLNCLNYMANIYFKLKQFEKAIECFEKELKIFNSLIESATAVQKQKNKIISLDYLQWNKAGCLNNIGACYASLNNSKEALVYLNQSLELRQLIDSKTSATSATKYVTVSDLMNSLNNLGVVVYNLGDYAAALSYFKRENELNEFLLMSASDGNRNRTHSFRKLNLNSENIHRNIGMCHYNMSQFKEASDNFKQALDYNSFIGGNYQFRLDKANANVADDTDRADYYDNNDDEAEEEVRRRDLRQIYQSLIEMSNQKLTKSRKYVVEI